MGVVLLVYSLVQARTICPARCRPCSIWSTCVCGLAIYYSLMIALGASTVWMGRNLTLYDFWFYITTFSRYPMEIYSGPLGRPLRSFFTFVIPVLIVINVPARMLVWPLESQQWPLAAFASVGGRRQRGRLALALSGGTEQLPQREQLRHVGWDKIAQRSQAHR